LLRLTLHFGLVCPLRNTTHFTFLDFFFLLEIFHAASLYLHVCYLLFLELLSLAY
jgi:hypothetical protein